MTQLISDIYCTWNKDSDWKPVDESQFWTFFELVDHQDVVQEDGYLSYSTEHAGIYIRCCMLKKPLDQAPAMDHDQYAFLETLIRTQQVAA